MNTIEKPTCKTCGFYENNCPFIRGKFMPYPNYVCKDYTFSTLKAEQLLKSSPLPEDTLVFKKGVEEGRRLEREDIENEWLEDRGGCFLDGVNEGKKAMKEQMLKEAVEADVNTYRNLEEDTSWAEFVVEMPTNNLGDKVRIIILPKEDGQ